MSDTAYDKPLPSPSPESQPFWDGLKARRFVLQRCRQCKQPRHYPRLVCSSCYSMEREWFEASIQGKVHSWTVSHHPYHPGFKRELPYVLVTVELDAGVRMVGQLEENDASLLALETPVKLTYHDVTEEFTLWKFSLDV